jgi:hypothetical protein
MERHCRPLVSVLADLPDPRRRQGRRHPLPAVLSLACVAMLCGYQSYGAIAEWARHYGRHWARSVGLTHPTPPCAATLHTILRALDRAQVEAVLGAWAEEVLAALPPAADELEGVALDGKTLRGSRQQGLPGAHLLAAVSQRLGLTLGQTAVGAKTNEIPLAQTLLAELVLAGRVFTMDALLTQRAIAATIVAGGGDYIMVVKPNQPQLYADIQTVFDTPPPSSPPPAPPRRRATRGTGGSNGGSSL